MIDTANPQNTVPRQDSAVSVFWIFLRLGCTSFGGPIAHIAYFRTAFVTQRRWLDEPQFADLVALCQFLPGPASSQLGIALGLMRAGYWGAFAAWLGFTLPSALLMLGLAQGVSVLGEAVPAGLIHGLKVVAVAVVAQALWGMARSLCPDRARILLMTVSAGVVLVLASAWAQWAVMMGAAVLGGLFFRSKANAGVAHASPNRVTARVAVVCLAIFGVLLMGLPWASAAGFSGMHFFDHFYRAGALVFGGGHVVLPLLHESFVTPGLLNADTFLTGYAAAQALPGPLFTLAAYLGAVMHGGSWWWGLFALLAIFAPSFLLVVGSLPHWNAWRANPAFQAALMGVNAAVVGLLLATLYQPLWVSTILTPLDFFGALACLVVLTAWRMPPGWAVLVAAVVGWAHPKG